MYTLMVGKSLLEGKPGPWRDAGVIYPVMIRDGRDQPTGPLQPNQISETARPRSAARGVILARVAAVGAHNAPRDSLGCWSPPSGPGSPRGGGGSGSSGGSGRGGAPPHQDETQDVAMYKDLG